jgi:hypothetical protein
MMGNDGGGHSGRWMREGRGPGMDVGELEKEEHDG